MDRPVKARGRWQASGLGEGAGHPVDGNGRFSSVCCPTPPPQLSLQPMGRVQPVTFVLFVLQNKLQKAEREEPAGISWADIYFDSGFSLPASFLGT